MFNHFLLLGSSESVLVYKVLAGLKELQVDVLASFFRGGLVLRAD